MTALPESLCRKVFREAWHYFAMHDRPVLGYSGGAESNPLLELLAPFKNVLTRVMGERRAAAASAVQAKSRRARAT